MIQWWLCPVHTKVKGMGALSISWIAKQSRAEHIYACQSINQSISQLVRQLLSHECHPLCQQYHPIQKIRKGMVGHNSIISVSWCGGQQGWEVCCILSQLSPKGGKWKKCCNIKGVTEKSTLFLENINRGHSTTASSRWFELYKGCISQFWSSWLEAVRLGYATAKILSLNPVHIYMLNSKSQLIGGTEIGTDILIIHQYLES